VLEVENEPPEETARRIVARFPPGELAQLFADWLDAHVVTARTRARRIRRAY